MTSRWLSMAQVVEHLGVCRERVRDGIRLGESAAWVNYGSAAQPRYRFDADEIDSWWRDVCRAFASAEVGGRSAGTRSPASPRLALARRAPQRPSSREASKPRGLSAEIGDLVMLARDAARGHS